MFGTIAACYATGDVHGMAVGSAAGGLVGSTGFSTVIASWASGDVSASADAGSQIGGLVGQQKREDLNCLRRYATGNVVSSGGDTTVARRLDRCE